MVEWTNEDAMFFNNVKGIEEQFYKFNKVVADGSGDLKTEIKKLFETMRNVSLPGFSLKCIIFQIIILD